MLARMSVKIHRDRQAEGAAPLGSALRREFVLAIALGTAAIFLATGSQLVEIVAHPLALIGVFIWLFAVILWSAVSAARHADCLAIKWGEPYGTLILTLSAITIEVVVVSTAMLQHYNLQGVNSYINVIMTLAVLGLVLPNFTTTTSGPTFSIEQEIFLTVVSVLLYTIFLLMQTVRHRRYFIDSNHAVGAPSSAHHSLRVRSAGFHTAMLLLYLITVILLAERFAIPLDNSIERFGLPQEFGGAMIAALVLAPEGIAAVEASLKNELQHSINILLGSVLATIGLTIPAVLTIGFVTKRSVALGVQGGNLPLLLLTLAVSVVTFTSRRTNFLQGCVHLLLFAVFVLLIFAP